VITRKIHNLGHLVLESVSGSDLDIVNSARVSFNESSQGMDDRNRGLINFLMRERHGTPFEAPTIRWDVKAPIFVFREWHRHRIGWSYNEHSARYSVIPNEYYIPEPESITTQVGKPGEYTFEPMDEMESETYRGIIAATQHNSFTAYERMLEAGVAKQVARAVLPVGTYSRMKAGCNLRSAMHFLSLRNHAQAQYEIRAYAEVMEEMLAEHFPVAIEAFVKNGRVCP